MRYTILLHPEDEGGFSVTVPALDGCVTQGDTFVDAVENARDAIEGHLAVLAQHGWEIPIERHPWCLSVSMLKCRSSNLHTRHSYRASNISRTHDSGLTCVHPLVSSGKRR